MTIANITSCVSKGFGTGVGGFSNTATCFYAMAAIFNKPEQQEQHDTIMRRIKLLREIVGQEIDRIKGADKPFLPSDWKKFEQIDPADTEEERVRKFKHKSVATCLELSLKNFLKKKIKLQKKLILSVNIKSILLLLQQIVQ